MENNAEGKRRGSRAPFAQEAGAEVRKLVALLAKYRLCAPGFEGFECGEASFGASEVHDKVCRLFVGESSYPSRAPGKTQILGYPEAIQMALEC